MRYQRTIDRRRFFPSLAFVALVIFTVTAARCVAQPPVQQRFLIAKVDANDEIVTTAEEYLRRYRKSPKTFIRAELPPEELKIVANAFRKMYPFESMVERLAYERKHFGDAITASKEKSEKDRIQTIDLPLDGNRPYALRLVHAGQVDDFVNRNGVGRFRIPPPSPSTLSLPEPVPTPLATAPVSEKIARESVVELSKRKGGPRSDIMPSEQDLSSHSKSNSHFFATPGRWGYVKDREHVAGFMSHGVRFIRPLGDRIASPANKTSKAAKYKSSHDDWKTTSLELVSLLKHDEPAAYVSENLPLMSELVEAEIRSLSQFESDAINQLRQGKEIVHRATANRIQMVGAIRASENCTECHYAPVDSLLGAFSYEFVRVPQIEPSDAKSIF